MYYLYIGKDTAEGLDTERAELEMIQLYTPRCVSDFGGFRASLPWHLSMRRGLLGRGGRHGKMFWNLRYTIS